jgi:hypothetical protein
MEIEWRLFLPLLGVAALLLLVTGPGLWSETWGWWWVRKPKRPARGSRRD